MTVHMEKASRFRERAEELRVIAEDWKSDETRLMLQSIALDYERMAAGLDRIIAGADVCEGTQTPKAKSATHGSAEYQFRLVGADGSLLMQYAQYCADDDDALRVPKQMLFTRQGPLSLEVWDGDRCVYEGKPADWPFAPHISRTH